MLQGAVRCFIWMMRSMYSTNKVLSNMDSGLSSNQSFYGNMSSSAFSDSVHAYQSLEHMPRFRYSGAAQPQPGNR